MSFTDRGIICCLIVAGALAGCASPRGATPVATTAGDQPRRLAAASSDTTADAYYYFAVSQLQTQAGRNRESVAALEEAIKRAPTSPWPSCSVPRSSTLRLRQSSRRRSP